MGSSQKEEEKIINPKLEKDKKNILKGTYEDRFKVENKNPLDFYDMIINIDSFSKKPEIVWKIESKSKQANKDTFEEINNLNYEENKNKDNKEVKINEEEKNIKTKNNKKDKEGNIIIGMIGLGNVGKSYLLSLFTGEELPTGDSIHTKGISIKKKDKIIILDSEGVEAPLIEGNVSKDLCPEDGMLQKKVNDSDELIQTIAKDKKAVELFIQDFIIEKSNILFIVVGQLTLTEQKLINRVVKETNKELIFVIHNLKNLYSKDQINNYIENTFKKNVFIDFNNFSEQSYKEEKNTQTKDEFNKYFLETYKIDEKNTKKVMHLIMASNVSESEAYYYNKTAVDYVRSEITSYNKRKKFDIIEGLKDFIIKRSEKYIESLEGNKCPFKPEDITVEKDGDTQFIKIKNNTKLKRCLINQLGFSSFYGSLYSPNYVCYIEKDEEKKEKKFIVEINLCGIQGEDFELDVPKRDEITEDGHKIILSFTGRKKLKEYKGLELIKNFSNIESGDFRIDIVLDYHKYKFKEKIKIEKKKGKGIVKFIYPLVFEDVMPESQMKDLTIEHKKIKEKDKEKKENKN